MEHAYSYVCTLCRTAKLVLKRIGCTQSCNLPFVNTHTFLARILSFTAWTCTENEPVLASSSKVCVCQEFLDFKSLEHLGICSSTKMRRAVPEIHRSRQVSKELP